MNPAFLTRLKPINIARVLFGKKAAIRKDLAQAYSAEKKRHAKNMPQLSGVTQRIVGGLHRQGISCAHIDELAMPETPGLLSCADRLSEMIETESTKDLGPHYDLDFWQHVPYLQMAQNGQDLFQWALSTTILDIAESYIGLKPAFIGADLKRDYNELKDKGNRRFHYDLEEHYVKNQLKICIYLTDVNEQTPHLQFVHPNDVQPQIFYEGNFSETEFAKIVPRERWRTIFGKRGTVLFLASNKFFHRINVPPIENVERRTLWFVYTTQTPTNVQQCKDEFTPAAFALIEEGLKPRQLEAVTWYKKYT